MRAHLWPCRAPGTRLKPLGPDAWAEDRRSQGLARLPSGCSLVSSETVLKQLDPPSSLVVSPEIPCTGMGTEGWASELGPAASPGPQGPQLICPLLGFWPWLQGTF